MRCRGRYASCLRITNVNATTAAPLIRDALRAMGSAELRRLEIPM